MHKTGRWGRIPPACSGQTKTGVVLAPQITAGSQAELKEMHPGAGASQPRHPHGFTALSFQGQVEAGARSPSDKGQS